MALVNREYLAVYAIGYEGHDESGKPALYVKFGVTGDPERRIKDLQTGNPHQLRELCKPLFLPRVDAERAEAWIHLKLRSVARVGEWFCGDIDPLDVLIRAEEFIVYGDDSAGWRVGR